MNNFLDLQGRKIRFTDERLDHISYNHPEMTDQLSRIEESLMNPDLIIRSRSDHQLEMFYRFYKITPVTSKYLCTVVKVLVDDLFIITAYYKTRLKKGKPYGGKK